MGKIGLPLAALYAANGLTIIGCDINQDVVDAINLGISPIEEEPGLAEEVADAVTAGRLCATTDTTWATAQSDVVVVIVPLIIDSMHRPDYSSIDAATRDIAAGLHANQLIIYETTLPVGTTRRRFGRLLQEISGLTPGEDFGLAFSPERVYSGRIFSDLTRYPKVVGGINPESTTRTANFYRRALNADILEVESAEVAEFTKLIETTYRDVNIALANEFARCADIFGIDATAAIQAANTQPFSHIHTPGVGVGGHCIPVYPYFLMTGCANGTLELVRLARRINDAMPNYTADILTETLGDLTGRRVLILGLAYRENVKESAFTATTGLIEALRSRGAQILLNDPLFSREEIEVHGVESVELTAQIPVDAVILQAYHDAYRNLDLSLFPGCRVMLDGRNALNPESIEACGVKYVGIGR